MTTTTKEAFDAIAGPNRQIIETPDDKHLQHMAEILENSTAEVWRLTRSDRVATWQNEFKTMEGVDIRRVVVTSVAAFVG